MFSAWYKNGFGIFLLHTDCTGNYFYYFITFYNPLVASRVYSSGCGCCFLGKVGVAALTSGVLTQGLIAVRSFSPLLQAPAT